MQFRNTPRVAIVILALLTPLVCSGASYAYIGISELRRGSDAIVLGTVTSIISVESGEDSIFVEIEVERYRKMPLEASSRIVLYYTRSSTEFVTPEEEIIIDDVSGVEWGFKVGERVYVFLKSLTPDYYEVYGGFQGKYSVARARLQSIKSFPLFL